MHLQRLGTNHHFIPVNNPDTNRNARMHMHQNATNIEQHMNHAVLEAAMAARFEAHEDDSFSQPRVFYRVKIFERKDFSIRFLI
jgi:catalase